MPLNLEHVPLPFVPAALQPAQKLLFAPHAEDEAFGMGGCLLKAFKRG